MLFRSCFTIDPVDAKDFDDAISIRKTKNGTELGIHIADVSHFVQSNSEIDSEAMYRVNSVYFTEGVVHMLPRALSVDLCSLLFQVLRRPARSPLLRYRTLFRS